MNFYKFLYDLSLIIYYPTLIILKIANYISNKLFHKSIKGFLK